MPRAIKINICIFVKWSHFTIYYEKIIFEIVNYFRMKMRGRTTSFMTTLHHLITLKPRSVTFKCYVDNEWLEMEYSCFLYLQFFFLILNVSTNSLSLDVYFLVKNHYLRSISATCLQATLGIKSCHTNYISPQHYTQLN